MSGFIVHVEPSVTIAIFLVLTSIIYVMGCAWWIYPWLLKQKPRNALLILTLPDPWFRLMGLAHLSPGLITRADFDPQLGTFIFLCDTVFFLMGGQLIFMLRKGSGSIRLLMIIYCVARVVSLAINHTWGFMLNNWEAMGHQIYLLTMMTQLLPCTCVMSLLIVRRNWEELGRPAT